ncbi:hypothetical protein ABT115_26225 [Streptomyces sp. NPDC001832]|uniref:hypothetical protein n=1 Tax=Streptomyces sp. NPDC001832 TaxID=3154527 RepID=UPI003333DE8E
MPSVVAPGPGVRRLVTTVLLSLAIAAVAYVLTCGVQAQDGHHVSLLSAPLSAAAEPQTQDTGPAVDTAGTADREVNEAGHHPAAPEGCCDAAVLLGEAPTRSGPPFLAALLFTLTAWGLMTAGFSVLSRRLLGVVTAGPPCPAGFPLLQLVCVSRT